MSTPLVIVGAGGLGRETATVVTDINRSGGDWKLLGFVDDDERSHGTEFLGVPVIGNSEWLLNQDGIHYVIAIGSSRVRRGVGENLNRDNLVPASLVHPTVAGHATHRIGSGVIVFRGAVLMLAVQLGDHVIVDVNATVGHDAKLDAYTTLHPGTHISGNVHTGRATELGTGAVLLEGISVGENTVIGAGAVVTTDLPPDCTAVGIPARPVSPRP